MIRIVRNMGSINRHIILSSFLNPLAGVDNMTTLSVGLFEKELVQLLAESLNFTFSTIHPLDSLGPGLKIDNGSSFRWTGCMGQIYRKEADVCVSFPQTWELDDRRQVADFSYPITWDDVGMLMPAPRQVSNQAFLLFSPFPMEIWILLFLSATVVTIFLWWNFRKDKFLGCRLTLSRWFLFVIASMSMGERSYFMHNIGNRQGGWTYRWIAIVWCFPISFVLIKVYGNVVLSMMAVPNQVSLIRGIVDLPNRPDVTVYVYRGSNADIYFSMGGDEFKSVGDQLRKNPKQRLPPSDVLKVIDAVEGKSAVFLASRSICQSILDYHLEENGPSSVPRLVLSKEIFQPRGRQMIFQKNSPLTEIFNKQIVLLQQHGLIAQAARRTILKDAARQVWSDRQHLKEDTNHSLTLGDIIGTFIILTVGYFCAVLTFASERLRLFQVINKALNNNSRQVHPRNSIEET